MPLMPGIEISMHDRRRGLSRAACSIAAFPLAAVPTTRIPCCRSSTARRPSRTTGWSSTSSTEIVGRLPGIAEALRIARTPGDEGMALSSRARRCAFTRPSKAGDRIFPIANAKCSGYANRKLQGIATTSGLRLQPFSRGSAFPGAKVRRSPKRSASTMASDSIRWEPSSSSRTGSVPNRVSCRLQSDPLRSTILLSDTAAGPTTESIAHRPFGNIRRHADHLRRPVPRADHRHRPSSPRAASRIRPTT